MNGQLFSILSETATGTLKDAVMALEKEPAINGAKLLRDLSRDYLDGSKEGLVALGQRVVKPARSSMDALEDRLRAWEDDVKRLDRMSSSGKVSDELKPVYLEDLMPTELSSRYELDKHELREYVPYKAWLERMILEHKNKRSVRRGKGLHELEEGKDEDKGSSEPVADNLLFSLLLHAKDEDVAKVLPPSELQTFQRWKQQQKGGKGGFPRRWSPTGSGGKNGSPTSPATGAPGASSPGASANGACSHCGALDHFKRDCPVLDAIMAERRAKGLSPPRGQKGAGKGEYGGGSGGKGFGGKGGGGKGGKGTFVFEHPHIDGWFPAGAPAAGWSPAQPTSPTLAQMSAEWSGGWGGRLCNVLERNVPSVEDNQRQREGDQTTAKLEKILKKYVDSSVPNFESENKFAALSESSEIRSSPANASVVPSQMSLDLADAADRNLVPVPTADRSWTRSGKTSFKPPCVCGCTVDSLGETPAHPLERDATTEQEASEEEVSKIPVATEEMEKKKAKKNQAARKATRKLVEACALETMVGSSHVEVVVSDFITKYMPMDGYSWRNNDGLMYKIAERKAMAMAKFNYAMFHGVDEDSIGDDVIRKTSAGVMGWSQAAIDIGLLGSSHRSPGAADETGGPPLQSNDQEQQKAGCGNSKPRVEECREALEAREKQVHQQTKDERDGKTTIGIFPAKQLQQVLGEEWTEVKRERRLAEWERRQAELHVLTKEQDSKQQLLNIWKKEDHGWQQIEVVLDSGAADSVCPKDMCPQFGVEDSEASKAGVYYTSANGGKLYNLGQTHVPICLDNGARTLATFQVADVSRPLMSVSKVCEMGNRVVFGANGGFIVNLSTGSTTEFIKKEGIYVFVMWVPPLSEAPFGRPR